MGDASSQENLNTTVCQTLYNSHVVDRTDKKTNFGISATVYIMEELTREYLN